MPADIGLKKLFIKYKNISLFTTSAVILNISSLISGFLVYRWIDPYYIGVWQTMMLIQTYSAFLRLGVINGMNRELPFCLGKGDTGQARKYAETAQYFSLANIAIFTALALPALLFVKMRPDWYFPLISIVIVICLNFYNAYLTGTFRANADFEKLSHVQLIDSGLRIISLALVYFYGFNGYCLMQILLAAAITLITHLWRPIRVKPALDMLVFKALLKTGLPIFAGSYLFNFFNTLPRLVLIQAGSVEMLGLYAPVLTLIGAMGIVPDSIGTYLYPKLSFQLGTDNDPKRLWSQSLKSHLALLAIGIPLAVAGYFAIPYIIDNFLPKYIRTKDVINLGLAAGVFFSFKFGYTILTTLKSWAYMSVYIISFGLLQYFIPMIMLRYYEPLKAVVLGQMVSFMAMYAASLIVTCLATHHPQSKLVAQ